MAAVSPGLKLLDQASVSRELDLASELFHRINRVIPPNQTLLTVPSTCLARDAVLLMRQHGYSQVPVMANGEVLGVFSFRSFATESAHYTLQQLTRDHCAPGDLRVEEFIERFEFARVTEEMSAVFEAIDRDNGILVGSPERLIGIVTPMDFLRYLHQVASPFVMVSEIELALRALIKLVLDEAQLREAARRSLASAYGSRETVPTTLEGMTFDNYQSLISYGDNWPAFEPVFGAPRTRTSGKLKEIGGIRNDLFHFKRELTTHDHQSLASHRNWLLTKIRQAEARSSKRVAR